MPPRLLDWYRSTFGHAMLGAALFWAALPPCDLWPLAWIAPLWWVLLIRKAQLAGQRPYRALWLAGFLFWLAALHWLRLPHWTTAFGWVALAAYLAFYLPVFVGLGRVAVGRLRLPVILTAPVVWTGLELARAHLLSGITMAALGHTQYRWIELVQLSDLVGAYGVDFVVMLVAACLGCMVPCGRTPRACWPLGPAAAVVSAALLYGYLRTAGADVPPDARVALIQGSIESEMKSTPGTEKAIHQQYFRLSDRAVREAARRSPPLDLLVWPETMYRETFVSYDPNARMPDFYRKKYQTVEQFRAGLKKDTQARRDAMSDMARWLDVPLLLGVDSRHFGPEAMQYYNSAVFVSADGGVHDPYHKMHRVPFGEYVPFSRYLPWLQRLTPLGVNLDPGIRPVAFEVGPLRIAPNICYESVLSHVIRRQVRVLQAQGNEPNTLVNLTNDGWFRGSSELDMHLACAVFRAVECRKPFLVAANTGITAVVDADGRIVRRLPRQNEGFLLAEVRFDRRKSWYLHYGDWPAGICLAACMVFAAVGCRHRFRRDKGDRRIY